MKGSAEAEVVVEREPDFNILATQVAKAALDETGMMDVDAAAVSLSVEVDVETLPATVDEGGL